MFGVVWVDFGRAPAAGNRIPDTGKRLCVLGFGDNCIVAADALRRGGFEEPFGGVGLGIIAARNVAAPHDM